MVFYVCINSVYFLLFVSIQFCRIVLVFVVMGWFFLFVLFICIMIVFVVVICWLFWKRCCSSCRELLLICKIFVLIFIWFGYLIFCRKLSWREVIIKLVFFGNIGILVLQRKFICFVFKKVEKIVLFMWFWWLVFVQWSLLKVIEGKFFSCRFFILLGDNISFLVKIMNDIFFIIWFSCVFLKNCCCVRVYRRLIFWFGSRFVNFEVLFVFFVVVFVDSFLGLYL